MNVLICACGTGGHYYPALVVSHLLSERGDNFVVVVDRPEAEAAARSFLGERARLWRVEKTPSGRRIRPVQLARVVKAALAGVRSIGPDVTLNMGGGGSFPFALASRFWGVPLVLHEANAFPGRANRVLARFSAARAYAIPGAHPFYHGPGAIPVGMPLRTYSPDSAALQASYPELAAFLDRADRGPAVLVTGGSQGALPVNRIVIDMLKTRPDLANRMRLVILTGAAWEEQVRAELGAAAEKVFVAGLVSELPRWLHLFDFAICRSGSSTLWELIRARVPSLLIPLPHAADDHQRLNAVWASSIGPMIEVPQNEMNGQRLASILDEVIGNYRGQRSSGGRWSSRLEQFPESPAEALIEILAEHCPADRVQSSMAIAGPSAASRHLGIHGNG